jgi:DNA-binding response OmpR family regulator
MNNELYQIGFFMMESPTKHSLTIGRDVRACGLGQALRDAGFNVIEVSEYSDGIRSLVECMPQVVIISEDVPEVWHPGAIATLKEGEDVPVLVMGSGEEDSLLAAIERGADGYLDRRASSREQIARIRAVLRRWE